MLYRCYTLRVPAQRAREIPVYYKVRIPALKPDAMIESEVGGGNRKVLGGVVFRKKSEEGGRVLMTGCKYRFGP